MSTDADAEVASLCRLFVETTGETTIRERQLVDAGTSHLAGSNDLEDYKRRHDAVSRHVALQDAISEPETR
ncbi:MAG: hypothetical protein ABEJ28_01750 [Salinigranum sp.]